MDYKDSKKALNILLKCVIDFLIILQGFFYFAHMRHLLHLGPRFYLK